MFAEAVARAAGDAEARDRMQAAEDAAEAHERGKRTFGLAELRQTFPPEIASKVAEWLDYRCKGRRRNGEDVQHGPADNQSLDEHLEKLNGRFSVVRDGGRTRVLAFEPVMLGRHQREIPTFLRLGDFKDFFMNRRVATGDRTVPLGHWWLAHPDRCQYEGIVFLPGGEQVIDGRRNLWRGWAIEPKAGDWSLMRRHVVEVLAAGDTAAAEYILNWAAWAAQHPAERAEVALVFRGPRGSGKGTFGNALCHIFGQHSAHISSADHLAGRFNAHLRDCCLLFADESYWPGDRGAEGTLKRLITEPTLFIEGKGKDGVAVPNVLHVLMESNEDWIIPAGENERRFVPLDVSGHVKQSAAWFVPLYTQLEAGGYAAMLHDLLHRDLANWHPRRIVSTAALVQQQAQSLRPEDLWWSELLECGVIAGTDGRRADRAVSNRYEVTVVTEYGSQTVWRLGLYDQARQISPKLKGYADAALGRYLTDRGCDNTQKVMRKRGWHFPPLAEARSAWCAAYPGWKWRIPDLQEWQNEDENVPDVPPLFKSGTR